jgi:hypothetical protein
MSQENPATSPPQTEVDQNGPNTRFPDGMPPTRTVERMDAPPLSSNPTSAQLKADIDSGATGDKIGVFDPGLSPLGTDDEAGGTSPSPERIRLARHFERTTRWAGRKLRGTSHTSRDPVLISYVGAIVVIGLVLVIGIALVR